MREIIVFLRCIICDVYQVFLAGNPVPVTLILMDVIVMFPLESPFPFFILHVHLCYELNDFFCFSLVLFDGLIIALLRLFVNTFLRFYGIIFIYLFCYVFIFYNLFVFFIIFCKFVVL